MFPFYSCTTLKILLPKQNETILTLEPVFIWKYHKKGNPLFEVVIAENQEFTKNVKLFRVSNSYYLKLTIPFLKPNKNYYWKIRTIYYENKKNEYIQSEWTFLNKHKKIPYSFATSKTAKANNQLTEGQIEEPDILYKKEKNITRLTFDDENDEFAPAVSNNGKKLIFVSNKTKNYEIYMKNLEEKENNNIIQCTFSSDDNIKNLNPFWLKDNKTFGFYTNRPDKEKWHLFTSTKGKGIRFINIPFSSVKPEWLYGSASKNSDKFVFTINTQKKSKPSIWLYENDSNRFTRLISGCFPDIYENKIVYCSDITGNYEIWKIEIKDDSIFNETQLTYYDGWDYEPVWSPDGKKIAFTSHRSGNSDIWIMDANGGNVKQVTSHPMADRKPQWENNETIIFQSNRNRKCDKSGNPKWDIWQIKVENYDRYNKTTNTPYKYNLPTENINTLPTHNVQEESWIVFSDRNDNITYTEYKGKIVEKNIKFLEKFYVVEEKGNWVRLIKDDNFNLTKNTPSVAYHEYGWINKKFLLLWDKSIVNNISKIDKKVMLVNKPSVFKKNDDYNNVLFYLDPDLKVKSNIKQNLYEILFVYKITDKSVLLGTTPRFNKNDTVGKYVLGWAPKDKIISLENLIAIEPNFNIEAIKERIDNNIKTQIFINQTQAMKFKQGKINNNNNNLAIWNNDKYGKRKNGSWLRFPILPCENCKDKGIIKIGVIGEINNNDNKFNPSKNKYIDPYTSVMLNLLKKSGISDDKLSIACKKKYQFFSTGFTSIKIDNLKYPLFKKVLLIDRQQLGDMLNELGHVYNALTENKERKAVQNVWKKIIKKYSEDKNFENLTIKEINENFFGLQETSSLLMNVKLKDITNESIVSEKEFQKYKNIIHKKYKNLNNIFNTDNYPYSFMSNEIMYYWILLEDYLP